MPETRPLYAREMVGPVDLEALVRLYVPTDDAPSHDMALDVLENSRPMWPRSEFDPGHFTVSAFVLSPDRRSLLLIHHGKLDRWLQPGGHIETDDSTIESAARREVGEETGVVDLVRIGESLVRVDVHEIPLVGSEPRHLHLDLGVGFLAHSFEIGPIDEVLDARWVTFADLVDYDVDRALMAGADKVRSANE